MAAGLAQHRNPVPRRVEIARDPEGGIAEQPHHPHRGSGIDGALRALVVERHVAPGNRGVERPAGVGDSAAGFPELVEDLGLVGVTEVEAVGDA